MIVFYTYFTPSLAPAEVTQPAEAVQFTPILHTLYAPAEVAQPPQAVHVPLHRAHADARRGQPLQHLVTPARQV
jgi:hypothetical protein